MTEKFLEKIMKQQRVDTRKYRYIVREDIWGYLEIHRCLIADLGTSNAYRPWEIVAKEEGGKMRWVV